MKDTDRPITGPNVMTSCGLLIGGTPCTGTPWHAGLPIHIEDLTPGTIFDTPFEQGCEVITEPDAQSNFNAYDSEHVECSFSVVMVSRIAERRITPVSA
jgi:hypothetical protein